MKYILSVLSLIFLIFSFSITTNSYAASNSIFNNQTNKIPYCDDGWECGLKEWIEAIKDIDAIETSRSASEYIQAVVKYVLWFLALITIIIIIYSWFNILTSIWDEEKAKKSKTIIIYSIIWLAIIFLAWPISDFIFKVLNS